MALQKEILTENGSVGTYWRITNMSYNRSGNILQCTLNIYKDQYYRTEFPEHPVFMTVLTFENYDDTKLSLADVYSHIKANFQQLNDSIDI